MKPLRLVFVTPRFWPLIGSAERVTGNLAAALAARGCRVTIVTARWHPSWPQEIDFRGVPVVRLSTAPSDPWNTLRYTRSLGRWLGRNLNQFELVYVSGLRHDAFAAIRAVGRHVPVVLRASGIGRDGDCRWLLGGVGRRPIKGQCMKAAALVASSRVAEEELRLAGFPGRRIEFLANGVPLPPTKPPIAKRAARAALAEANQALKMPDWAPLALYTGRLLADKGLRHLVAAWQPIAARWPNARLWLAGQGPECGALNQQIESLNLAGRVTTVGLFDEVDELLDAADLFVLPSPATGMSLSLLEAMAAGLPVVAVDTPGNRALAGNEREGLLVASANAKALSAAIERLIDETGLATRLGAAGRKRAAEFSLDTMVDRHVALFERLLEKGC